MTTATRPVVTSADLNEQPVSDQREYVVYWKIEMPGSSPEDAARGALEAQRDPRSMATVFAVRDNQAGRCWRVDLDADEGQRVRPEAGR